MSWQPPPPVLTLPEGLADETLAELLECLYELARSLENHYADQLHRYHHAREDNQQIPLWAEDEDPF